MSRLQATRPPTDRRWVAALVIVAPFLFVVVLFNWMATPFPTFHDTDEVTSHFPIIERYYAELPFPDLRDSNSATAPLFHVLFAFAAKIVGLDFQPLRLVNVVISAAAVFVFYGVVVRLAQDHSEALLLTLIFGLSPYFFGASFRLLTDNLGILFFLLALRSLVLSWEHPRLRNWGAFCAWSCLAMLTRQTYVWLVAGAFLGMLTDRRPVREIASRSVLLFAACAPLLALLLTWGGLTPPGRQEFHVEHSLMNFRAGVFGIALAGFYWSALCPDRVIKVLSGTSDWNTYALAGIGAASLLLLIAVPMAASGIDDGVLWRIAKILPTIGGSGILFWLLVPLGMIFAADGIKSGDQMTVRVLLLASAFLVCMMPNTRVYQKYFDPFILTFVILISFRVDSKRTISRLSRPLLLLAFVLYPIISWKFFYPR